MSQIKTVLRRAHWAGIARVSLACGVLLSPVTRLGAQQRPAAPTPEDSATCAAAQSYLAAHPDETRRMTEGMMQLMQSPEMQKAMAAAMQAAFQAQLQQNQRQGQPKAAGTASTTVGPDLDFSKLPDTTRVAVARALGSGQFDSLKALLRPVMGNNSLTETHLDLGVKMFQLFPDTLRALYATSLARGSMMEQCTLGDTIMMEEKPLPPPVIRPEPAPPSAPNHP